VPFAVVCDACVLYPAPLRDLLLRLATRGLLPHWSELILDECFRSLAANRPDLTMGALDRTRRLMSEAFPASLVMGHEGLIEAIKLPDANDRHVVAAATRARAEVIVTFNLGDFPAHALRAFEMEAQHPDEFVLNLIDLAPGIVFEVVREQAAALRNPPRTVVELLATPRAQGLVQSVAQLTALLP